ncbi:porin [Pseudomonas sp. 10B1]|uniref:OprO/OprP family phosphate-selective porin n=1 Tax=unclassified Pseudomonas TaxID=196821 RepID=UPI002AB3A309|nr:MULTISPECIES: porin [unclassified Pseudomonas]MDY7562908.1 porin [Pseudomonas sp. AB6]MEA9979241.1 porin [Pseudomonas sp. RTS4]MEA9997220.1 porin [Pseudomonas sp. AA4]MEB0088441.1 porin [Pseudomonas sp. RTI1]MEB0128227.1 porin [Pseudomonas sp. CCC1.2]
MISKYQSGLNFCVLALAVSADAFAGSVTTDGADIVVKTKGGLEIATDDDQFSFQLGGRIQADVDQFGGTYSLNGKTADSAYLRRARLDLSGKAYGVWGYDFAVDFSNSNTPIKEAFVSYLGFDPVTLQIGRFDPDFGLENAISSKWNTAIESSMISELAPWASDHDEGMGIQVHGTLDSFYGSASILRPSSNENENGKTQNNYNLRAVFAPWSKPGNVLHFGINYAYNDADESDGRIRTRLGVRGTSENGNGHRPDLAPKVAGAYDGDAAMGLEFAYAAGPFSVQSEYVRRTLEAKSESVRHDRDATGYYGQVAYTLTGESRGYKLDGASFSGVKPENAQWGAWEVFYRYDHANVEESGFLDSGAKVQTVGVNWYANQAVKVSANYLRTNTSHISNENGDNDGDALSLRLQYVF